jgi:hypothetical protein
VAALKRPPPPLHPMEAAVPPPLATYPPRGTLNTPTDDALRVESAAPARSRQRAWHWQHHRGYNDARDWQHQCGHDDVRGTGNTTMATTMRARLATPARSRRRAWHRQHHRSYDGARGIGSDGARRIGSTSAATRVRVELAAPPRPWRGDAPPLRAFHAGGLVFSLV